MIKRLFASAIVVILSINIVGCTTESAKEMANSAADKITDTAIDVKDRVVDWYSTIDFDKFKDGWDSAVDFCGAQYSAVMSSEYVANIETAISSLEADINSSVGSARGTAQEAGFLAEKWVSDTFNINAAANGSKYNSKVVGSNEFGSVDVETNYGEQASLKYYKDGQSSASAQAKTLLESYVEYCSKSSKEKPCSLSEYMEERGYDPKTQDDLLKSVYYGQTRIIASDQLEEATNYLKGRIDKLSTIEGDVAAAKSISLQETLDGLRDRLRAPDGTESKPLSRDEAQAIAELAQEGKFKPEDFGIKVTEIISPKYVVKQSVGTGLEVATINTVLTIGPDVYSVLKEAVNSGTIDDQTIHELGIEGAIAATEGFVEGSISRVVTTLCQSGILGEALKEASPGVIATLVIVAIEGAIHGYELSQGIITGEEYGNIMVDRIVVGLLSLPPTYLLLSVLPATKLMVMAGCMAGAMIACVGYTVAKDAVMDIVDAGGFEAIIPAKTIETMSVAKEKISTMNLIDNMSSFGDSIVSTAKDGYIYVSSLISD